MNDAARSVDRHRETARQHPAGRRICNSTGICPLPITGTRAQRPSNRKSCPTRRGMCSTLHTLNCFNQNAKDAPIRIGASFQRGFAFGITRAEHLVGMHSESPGSNALPAGIRNRQSDTPCRHAFACARAECLCQAGNEQSGTRNLSSLADGLVKRSPSRASGPRPCGGSIPRTR